MKKPVKVIWITLLVLSLITFALIAWSAPAYAADPAGAVLCLGHETKGAKGNALNCKNPPFLYGHYSPVPSSPDTPQTVPGKPGYGLAVKLDPTKRQYYDASCDPLQYDAAGNCTANNAAERVKLDLNRFTLMAWINPTANLVDDTRWEVMEKAGAYWINIRSDTRQLRVGGIFNGCGAGSKWVYADSVPVIPFDKWTHVAATYNGAQLRVYIDGVPVKVKVKGTGTAVAYAPVTGATCVNTQPLTIGVKYRSDLKEYAAWYSGMIDDVKVWPSALTGLQVKAAMNTPLTN